MTILINAYQISKSFGATPLFTDLTFSIESGERIGLIGPNGAGKSTLLNILSGKESVDLGTISYERGIKISYLPQIPQFLPNSTVKSSILEGIPIQSRDDWKEMARAEELLSKLLLNASSLENSTGRTNTSITPDTPTELLSGGLKKRVALARELIRRPDLLLLDEPTNHLDVDSILWLENLLSTASFATLTVTHDRLFLQRISNRIIELDRRHAGGLLKVNGDYLTYLQIKEERISAQEKEEAKLKNNLRRETEWLARGAKARSTKQQARIQRAGELQKSVEELSARNQITSVRIDFQNAEKNPKKLIHAQNITKSYPPAGHLIVPPVNLFITPKSRIGILGPNGCGKTTLLKLLLGELPPDSGSIVLADKLQVAFFEQNRDSLDPQLSISKTVCPNGDFVDYRGTKVHIKGYLARFLFSGPQIDMPVGRLSGGEQARVLIAMLMLKKANILVLDEPTNDLDLATLEILQEVLQDFPGAILLVTHDRYFLSQVATEILAFHQDNISEKKLISFASFDQWESWYSELSLKIKENKGPKEIKEIKEIKKEKELKDPGAGPGTGTGTTKKKKLSFNEQKELDNMENTILEKEALLAELTNLSTSKEVIKNPTRLQEVTTQLSTCAAEVDRLYARWAQLTEKN